MDNDSKPWRQMRPCSIEMPNQAVAPPYCTQQSTSINGRQHAQQRPAPPIEQHFASQRHARPSQSKSAAGAQSSEPAGAWESLTCAEARADDSTLRGAEGPAASRRPSGLSCDALPYAAGSAMSRAARCLTPCCRHSRAPCLGFRRLCRPPLCGSRCLSTTSSSWCTYWECPWLR